MEIQQKDNNLQSQVHLQILEKNEFLESLIKGEVGLWQRKLEGRALKRSRTIFINSQKAWVDTYSRIFASRLAVLFQTQQNQVLYKLRLQMLGKSIKKEDRQFDLFFNAFDWGTMLTNGMQAVFLDVLLSSGARAHRVMGDMGASFMQFNIKARDWLRDKSYTFADEVNATTEKALGETLSEGFSLGETYEQLAARVSNVFQSTIRETGWRAMRIARTEVNAVSNFGLMEGFKESGVQRKQWLSASDARPWHLEASGQIVNIDSPFIVMGEELMYPGDESGSPENVINCFKADAEVWTRGGVVAIRNVEGKVLTAKGSDVVDSQVVSKLVGGTTRDWVRILFDRKSPGHKYSSIECTSGHKVFVNGDWKEASCIRSGDTLTVVDKGLSFLQEQFVRGSVLGDSVLHKYVGRACFRFYQSSLHGKYLDFVSRILGGKIRMHRTNLGDKRYSDMGYISLDCRDCLDEIYSDVYRGGKKVWSERCFDKLTKLGFAFWYMDDGSLDGKAMTIASGARTHEEKQCFIVWSRRVLGTTPVIYDRVVKWKGKSRPYVVIRISTRDSLRLLKDIGGVIYEGTPWKVPSCYVVEKFNFAEAEQVFSLSSKKVLTVRKMSQTRTWRRYNLSVPDTECFFVNGVLVHNCRCVVSPII